MKKINTPYPNVPLTGKSTHRGIPHGRVSSLVELALSLFVLISLLAGCSAPQSPLPVSAVANATTSTGTTFPVLTATVTSTKTPQLESTRTPTTSPTMSPTPEPTATTQSNIVVCDPTIPTPVPGQATANRSLVKGDENLRKGNIQQAIDHYNAAIVEYPWLLPAYYHLFSARQNLIVSQEVSEFDDEIRQLDQAINQRPDDAELYHKRGVAKFQRTITSGKPYIEEEPLHSSTVTVIGPVPYKSHLVMEEAIWDFDEAIRINSQYAEAYHMRGLAIHNESLWYTPVSLVDLDEEVVQNAIQNYEKAIENNPELSAAYNDLGTAYAHIATGSKEKKQEDIIRGLEQAIEEYSQGIRLDPQMAGAYFNRAYVGLLLNALRESEEDRELILQEVVRDAGQFIEFDPMNPWGYFLRGFAYIELSELGSDNPKELSVMAEEDFAKFDEIGNFLIVQYDLSELWSRLLTLSIGPSRNPKNAVVLGYEYTNTDFGFRLEIPNLLQPGARMLSEQAARGDLLVRFYDDLARWFVIQVHPGCLGDQTLEEWVLANITQNSYISDVTSTNNKEEVVQIRFRDDEWSAECATAVRYHQQRFYTLTYCLTDELDPNISFRTFASLYGIAYDPVDTILEEFLESFDFLSEEEGL